MNDDESGMQIPSIGQPDHLRSDHPHHAQIVGPQHNHPIQPVTHTHINHTAHPVTAESTAYYLPKRKSTIPLPVPKHSQLQWSSYSSNLCYSLLRRMRFERRFSRLLCMLGGYCTRRLFWLCRVCFLRRLILFLLGNLLRGYPFFLCVDFLRVLE